MNPSGAGDPIGESVTLRGLCAGQRMFGRFTLVRLLGRGGMGIVWLARDEELDQQVALKFLPEVLALDRTAMDDFRHETRRSRELTHSNIVRVHDFVRDERTAAIAMEFVDGDTVANLRLDRPTRVFEPTDLLPWVQQLAAALDYAHTEVKVVHRDLKPANLMVTAQGRLKVADFGISASVSETVTRVSRVASSSGTPVYMSPQQMMGEAPAPSDDIYSMGATLFELLTGKPPFFRGDIGRQVLHSTPPALAARRAELDIDGVPIPHTWEETIASCLAKEPAARPRSAGSVVARIMSANVRDWTSASATSRSIPPPADPASDIECVTRRSSPRGPVGAASGFVLSVDPAGIAARVWLGPYSGVPVDDGKLVLKDLPDGEHDLIVKVPGYHPYSTRVTVSDGCGEAVARLVAIKGAVQIRARGGTSVTATGADGRLFALGTVGADGTLKRENVLNVGTYTFRFDHTKFFPVEIAQQELQTGRILVLTPDQIPLPGEMLEHTLAPVVGSIELRVANLGAQDVERLVVSVDGHAVHTRAAPPASGEVTDGTVVVIDALEVGLRRIEIAHPDFETSKQHVSVHNQETTPVAVTLKPRPATLTIVVQGPTRSTLRAGNEEVAISGSSAQVRLPACERIELELAALGYKSARRSFSLAANRPTTWNVALERIRGAEAGQPWTVPELDLEMEWIAPGSFVMGTASGGDDDERPVTQVRLTRGFWLGRTEVTQRQWRALMGDNPSGIKGDDRPVEQVSWEEAMAFCGKLTERERSAERLLEGHTYTLPTEAQWEYACRAGTSGDFAGSLDAMAWYNANSGNQTHPVAQKQSNRWGLYDMHGNVWEWCADWYGDYPGGSITDPQGASSGTIRVLRGGCWRNGERLCRSALRYWCGSGHRYSFLGFRLALSSVR